MDVLSTGLGLIESPRWHDGQLWFSDWTAGEIIAIDDAGASELIVRHESMPLCFDFLPSGRPILVSNQQMALLTLEDDGSLATYADLSALSPFGFNDIVVDGHRNTYVNSVNFDLSAGPPDGEVQPGFVALVPASLNSTRTRHGKAKFCECLSQPQARGGPPAEGSLTGHRVVRQDRRQGCSASKAMMSDASVTSWQKGAASRLAIVLR